MQQALESLAHALERAPEDERGEGVRTGTHDRANGEDGQAGEEGRLASHDI